VNIKIGTDIVLIPRIERMLKTTSLLSRNIFTAEELKNQSAEHLAGIFAAKEAAIKALGLKPKSWRQIEVKKERDGSPKLIFSGTDTQKIKELHLSISHDGDYALATVIAIGK
jgi:phosphopantetheine--protein transferase-like protein